MQYYSRKYASKGNAPVAPFSCSHGAPNNISAGNRFVGYNVLALSKWQRQTNIFFQAAVQEFLKRGRRGILGSRWYWWFQNGLHQLNMAMSIGVSGFPSWAFEQDETKTPNVWFKTKIPMLFRAVEASLVTHLYGSLCTRSGDMYLKVPTKVLAIWRESSGDV